MSLTPDYLNISFDTLVHKLKTEILNTDTFKDVNYEGSNISVLVELFAYVSELNVYYLNKLAQNQFIDTADIYENVHRLSTFLGYNPKGYISSVGSLTIEASGSDWAGKEFKIDEWNQFSTTDITDDDGNPIYFANIETVSSSADLNGIVSFDLYIKQGKITKYTDNTDDIHRLSGAFSGSDLVNNKLILPFLNFGYDDNLDDEYESIKVFVDDVEWSRINNFYDALSGLTNESNVYTFNYDKYNRYIIEFNESRSVPLPNQKIEVWLLESLGSNGNVLSGKIDEIINEDIITNVDDNVLVDNDQILTITNSSAVNGGTDPESMKDIKSQSKLFAHAQYRNVTKYDYIVYLTAHNQISKSIVWGEQESNNTGNVFDYNKVYICVIPSGEVSTWTNLNIVPYTTVKGSTLYIPTAYEQSYKTTISAYLEPRKMLSAYEEYVVPELIYFSFSIGLKIKRTYRYINVLRDLKDKLTYYFSIDNRSFEETIKFFDIVNNMLDITYTSTDNNFSQTKGLENIIIRDISFFDTSDYTWKNPHAYNNANYPQWESTDGSTWDENILKNILLKRTQFPMIDILQCNFEQEN